MIAAVQCPRCGVGVELPVSIGARLVYAGGAPYVTAVTRAGKAEHTCPTRAPAWQVDDE